MQHKAYSFLIIACLLWGFQPVTIKIVTQEMNILTIIPLRFLIVSIILFIIMKITNEKNFLPPKKCLLTLCLMGFFGITVSNGIQFTGLQYSSVGNMTLISTTAPVITVILARIFLNERLNSIQIIGIIISFFGTLYLLSGGTLSTFTQMNFNKGDIYFFIGEVAWVIYILLSIPILKKISVLSATAWSGLFGSILTALFAHYSVGLQIVPLSTLGIYSFLFIILGGGITAMICWNLGTKKVGASNSAIFLNLLPVIGIISAYFTLNEPITMQKIISGIFIIFGVYVTTHSHKFVKNAH